MKKILLTILLFCMAPVVHAYQQENLKIGVPLQDKITNGEKHTYSLELGANKTVAIQVYQKGIDVVVRAFAPNSKKIAAVDAPIGENGAETLWFLTSSPGRYKIEISPYDEQGSGTYEIVILAIRSTIPQDHQIITSQEQLQASYNSLADAIYKMSQSGSRETTPSRRSGNSSSGQAAPSGASAECRDGSYSFSANRRGTCSHHGGVKRWL